MIFYNLDKEEVTQIIRDMGYSFDVDGLRKNFDYYLQAYIARINAQPRCTRIPCKADR